MKAPPTHALGESADAHFAGGLRAPNTVEFVDENAVGGGFAAANRMSIHKSRSTLCTQDPSKVCRRNFSESVYGRHLLWSFFDRPKPWDRPNRIALIDFLSRASFSSTIAYEIAESWTR